MRSMGIDYGAKRVGIALSDEMGSMAFPKTILANDKSLIENIRCICAEEKVEEIVVGESLDFNFVENPIMKKIRPFIEELKSATGIPVILEPEFMTSQAAERIQGKSKMHDASAAALILKSYLDKLNNQKQ